MAEIDKKQMLPFDTMLHGRYQVKRYLSSGGFGNTYVAVDTILGREVAVKEFYMQGDTHRAGDGRSVAVSNPGKQELFEAQQRKFRKEAQRISSLNSPYIIRVSDLFDENGTSYYVMDLVKGDSLAATLKRTGKPMAQQEAQQVLGQLLDALKTVHRQGFYHLDVKPGNIMRGAGGPIVLIDFGASKLMDGKGGATKSSALCYTPGYAPSEQIDQKPERIGAWTDIYAVGATLYKLVTLQEPPLPSEILDDGEEAFHFPANVSDGMRQLIVRLMRPRQKDRPQTVEEVLAVMSATVDKPGKKPVTPQQRGNGGTAKPQMAVSETIGRSECVYGGPNNMERVRGRVSALGEKPQKQDRFGFLKFFGHSILRLVFFMICAFTLYLIIAAFFPIEDIESERNQGGKGYSEYQVEYTDALRLFRAAEYGKSITMIDTYALKSAALARYRGEPMMWGVVFGLPLMGLFGAILLGIRKKQRRPELPFFSTVGLYICRSSFVYWVFFFMYSFIALFVYFTPDDRRLCDGLLNFYWTTGSSGYWTKVSIGMFVSLLFAFITGSVLFYQRKKKKRAVT